MPLKELTCLLGIYGFTLLLGCGIAAVADIEKVYAQSNDAKTIRDIIGMGLQHERDFKDVRYTDWD